MANDLDRESLRSFWREEKARYRSTEQGRQACREAFKRYASTEKGKAALKRAQQKRQASGKLREYQQQYRDNHKHLDTFKASQRDRTARYKHSEAGLAYARRYTEANREWVVFSKNLSSVKKGRPAITLDQYHARYESQDFTCAICHGESAELLHIDHCHKNGHFRGLLCNRCNNALGLFRDDPQLLFTAVEYLAKYQKTRQAVTL